MHSTYFSVNIDDIINGKYPMFVGARPSRLSLIQVEEVLSEIRCFYPKLCFHIIKQTTPGDLDQLSSLKMITTSDFFTKDIDALLISKKCHIAIHSAKDLPDPISPFIYIAALTKGRSNQDCIVLNNNAINKQDILIGTSSVRREEIAKKVFPLSTCVDIRGTIEQRLCLLDSNKVDGVIMAVAALDRLNILHDRPFVILPPPYAPRQGRLAVTTGIENKKIIELFSSINSI